MLRMREGVCCPHCTAVASVVASVVAAVAAGGGGATGGGDGGVRTCQELGLVFRWARVGKTTALVIVP
jgi:hypothetical protein